MHQSMMLRNMPVEFINVVPLNPLISACEIKILYAGKNRNKSYISKPVANQIANTLPNIPIVGEYLVHAEDFGDHAEELIINSQGVKFVKRTVAFGTVPADTKIWWQWFHDDDGVDREYLMCQGYLWTGRYPECKRVLEKGNGQSMEFDPETLVGNWATLQNEVDEYFIIDEAIFSALCILGEDVEPCFEGASVTAPKVLYSLNKDTFKSEMTQFMLDLKNALNSQEGGNQDMSLPVDNNLENQDPNFTADENGQDPVISNTDPVDPIVTDPTDPNFVKKPEDEEEEEEATEDGETSEDDEDKKKKKPSYTLEEVVEYQELKVSFDALQAQYNALVTELDSIKPEFTRLQSAEAASVKKDKEAMIARFSILDETDLVDVRTNIDTYSLEDIEAKLSVIAVRKKVNFNLDSDQNSDSNTEDPIVSYSATTVPSDSGIPAWLKAVEARKNSK